MINFKIYLDSNWEAEVVGLQDMQATTAREAYLDTGVFERFGARTELMTQRAMEKLGRYCATNPWFVLFIGK